MTGRGEIIPAILEERVEEVEEKLGRIEGKARVVSIDIIDGVFADNLTVELRDLVGVDFLGMEIEAQLMMEYPEDWLESCKEVGIARAFGHVERMGSQREFVDRAKELGIRPGLGLDLYTPVESLNKDLLMSGVDGVLLMSVKAGFSGQEFNASVLDKIRELRKMGYRGDIQMDGGMNPETARLCLEAGANQFGVTSYIWKAESVDEALRLLRQSVGEEEETVLRTHKLARGGE